MMGPVQLILGAAGGIGSAPCRQLAGQGCPLALAGRDSEPLRALATELDASVHTLDATDVAAVEQTVQDVVTQHGQLDGMVNCVGSILLRPAHRTTPEEWRSVLATNLDSAFATVREGTSAMLKTGGSIVLLSSAAARDMLIR
jgi:NAD(P)-dependent dehydrogenase (short-subunit alcohol dehydrogenase family)